MEMSGGERGAQRLPRLAWTGVGLVALGALAAPLAGSELWLTAVLVLGGAWCGLSMRMLLAELGKARKERALLDARMIHSHKLAALGELSAGIAHEINNPLAIIAREAELMEHLVGSAPADADERKAELQESIREVKAQVERCRQITSNLLSFARKMEPVFQKVDLNRLVEDMVRLVERETQGKGIQLHRQYHHGLEPIKTDPPGLRQVVLNLLNNARQAMEQGGTIVLRTRPGPGRGVEVEVQDTGSGIPREHLARIFDPFFTTKAHGKGTGLGLSICHGIVSRLGGRIEVKSEVGTGSSFTVWLPVEPDSGGKP